ncbi:MAG: sulfatase-like hydrolase/transferase [Cytophagales bacterium]|nr:sulfatase-like hydrolase/transferase [Cytophagales bacterium]
MADNKSLQTKFLDFVKFSSSLTLSLLAITLLLRLVELIQMVWIKPISDDSLGVELIGFLSDLGGFSIVALVLYGIGLLFVWNKVVYKSILYVLGVVYIIINFSTLSFFLTALVPMDQSMFTYSFEEIIVIIRSSQKIGFMELFIMIVPFVIFFFLPRFLQKKSIPIWLIPSIFILGGLVVKPMVYKHEKKTVNAINKSIITNKPNYYIKQCARYFFDNESEQSQIAPNRVVDQFISFRQTDKFYEKASGSNNIPVFEKSNIRAYPLLQKNTYNPLDPYFKEFTQKPNVVYIIVESLGERFFNKEIDPFRPAPFLDSLKNESLYWRNCFSTSERTFCVLPSTLGSLPYGKIGFNELKIIPDHVSVTSLLKENDYYSSFFYGGWTNFHGMARLLKKEDIDYISDFYPKKYKKIKANSKGFSWGYADEPMMQRSLDVIDSVNTSPMFNLYLTLSTHSPFKIPNREKYLNYIKKQLEGIEDEEKRKMILKYPDPFISVLYGDECIKNLIQEYKKRGLYDNTIFVITGDHVMHELGARTASDVYNVPLIIHSPLLKKSDSFEAVVSHHDIPPSLINLLKQRKVIKAPDAFTWMGYGLEMNDKPNKKFIPFMQNNKNIDACVYGNYFYSIDKQLYKFNYAQNIEIHDDPVIKEEIEKRLKNYQQLNSYICSNNLVAPLNIVLHNHNVKDIYDNKLIDEKELSKGNEWESEKLTLESDYSTMIFDLSLQISYADTNKNPLVGVRIYDNNGKYLDYYALQNDNYLEDKDKVNSPNLYKITRSVPNKGIIFKKGHQISFFIADVKKEISVENLKINVKGIEGEIVVKKQKKSIVYNDMLLEKIDLKTKGEWWGKKIFLNKDYNSIDFDLSVEMSYSKTDDNPIIGINVYNKEGKYIDYYHLQNDKYLRGKDKINQSNIYNITRSIPNEGNNFKEGHSISFFVKKVKKDVSIKDLKVKVTGIK